jgi:hypothetical protein
MKIFESFPYSLRTGLRPATLTSRFARRSYVATAALSYELRFPHPLPIFFHRRHGGEAATAYENLSPHPPIYFLQETI